MPAKAMLGVLGEVNAGRFLAVAVSPRRTIWNIAVGFGVDSTARRHMHSGHKWRTHGTAAGARHALHHVLTEPVRSS